MEENRIESSDSEKIVQYIVVRIGNEHYGININFVDNIVRMQGITRVPKTQVYYVGVINLRGEIIPVMSLRLKLGLESDQFTNKTRMIIIKIENAKVAIIVDEVREVVSLEESKIEKAAYDMNDDRTNYISAIGKNNGELISLLDVNAVVIEKDNA
ncbi:MAG: chemotaxis protein CheW [Lachnospiraceae bacterium]